MFNSFFDFLWTLRVGLHCIEGVDCTVLYIAPIVDFLKLESSVGERETAECLIGVAMFEDSLHANLLENCLK